MHLTVCINGSGYHPVGWRSLPRNSYVNAQEFRDLTALAESGGFAAAFFGVSYSDQKVDSTGRIAVVRPDALPLVSSLIAHTEKIGLGAAYALERAEPYNIARSFATLDRLSLGRTAWIIDLARANGRDAHENREYDRESECIEVVRKLWDSWEDEAFVVDKARGLVADSNKVHRIDHAGPYFSVRGPLNVPRPTQGHPVLAMTDSRDVSGRKLAAEIANLFIVNCGDGDAVGRIRQIVRSLAASASRNPDTIKVVMNVFPILGSTEAEARRTDAELSSSVDPALAFAIVQSKLGAPSALPAGAAVEGKLLSELWPLEGAAISAAGLSPPSPILVAGRDLAGRMSGLRFVGTPAQLSDRLEDLYTANACDGFNIMPPTLPNDLRLFVDHTIPLLRQKNLIPVQLTGRTLRDRLGLNHPRSRYAENVSA